MGPEPAIRSLRFSATSAEESVAPPAPAAAAAAAAESVEIEVVGGGFTSGSVPAR